MEHLATLELVDRSQIKQINCDGGIRNMQLVWNIWLPWIWWIEARASKLIEMAGLEICRVPLNLSVHREKQIKFKSNEKNHGWRF